MRCASRRNKQKALILIVVCLSFLMYSCQSENYEDIEKDNQEQIKEETKLTQQNEYLELVYDKDTVQTREEFSMTKKLLSPPESTITLIYMYKKGNEKKITSTSTSPPRSIGSAHLKAFVDGQGYFQTDFFYEAGTYIYEIELYTCSHVEEKTQIDICDSETRRKVSDFYQMIKDIEPSEKIYKEIRVYGETVEYECDFTEDCAHKKCENCKTGAQKCVQKLCVDCFFTMDCETGYECINKECVLK